MKKLLLASAALLLATASASAGNITFGIELDGGSILTIGPVGDTATVGPFTAGAYTIQEITGSTQPFVVAPDVLDTNTLTVSNTVSTNVPLHIFVSATNLPITGLQSITSSFDSVGLQAGWTVTDTSILGLSNLAFFGSPMFSDTFNGVAGSAVHTGTFDTGPGLGGLNSFTAEYTINANSILGQSNLGIDLRAISVPGPIVGAGLPGVILACGFLLALARRRRQIAC